MLSPNAKLSPQNGNWAPNFEFGDTKMKMVSPILRLLSKNANFSHKIGNEEPNFQLATKKWKWEQFPSIARPISQLRIRKANAVEKHANGRKSLAAGPKKQKRG